MVRKLNKKNMTAELAIEFGHEKRPVLKAIREYCIECMGNEKGEVTRCEITYCPLWPYRFATNPFHTIQKSEKQKAEQTARLMKVRGKQKSQEG